KAYICNLINYISGLQSSQTVSILSQNYKNYRASPIPMTPATYHRSSRYLHWVMAALLFYMVFLGWSFDSEDSGLFARFQLHKSVGILILFLTFLRIGLRVAYKAPPEIAGPKWQTGAAKAVHIGFYVLMIGLPLSGWAAVSASTLKIPTELF